MTWTYGGDPSANDRDEVRFLIQDTNTNDQLMSDEEIAYLLATYTASNYLAAAEACRVVALKFARDEALVEIGDTTVDTRKRAATYYALAESLMALYRRSLSSGGLFVGGRVVDDVDDLDEDTTLVQPKYRPADWENS